MSDNIKKEFQLNGIKAHGANTENIISIPENVTLITWNCPEYVRTSASWIFTSFAKNCNTWNKLFDNLLRYSFIYELDIWSANMEINNMVLEISLEDPEVRGFFTMKQDAKDVYKSDALLESIVLQLMANPALYDQYLPPSESEMDEKQFDMFENQWVSNVENTLQFRRVLREPFRYDFKKINMEEIDINTELIDLESVFTYLKKQSEHQVLLLHACRGMLFPFTFKFGNSLINTIYHHIYRNNKLNRIFEEGNLVINEIQNNYVIFQESEIETESIKPSHHLFFYLGLESDKHIYIEEVMETFMFYVFYCLDKRNRERRLKFEEERSKENESFRAITKLTRKLLYERDLYIITIQTPKIKNIENAIDRIIGLDLNIVHIEKNFTDDMFECRIFLYHSACETKGCQRRERLRFYTIPTNIIQQRPPRFIPDVIEDDTILRQSQSPRSYRYLLRGLSSEDAEEKHQSIEERRRLQEIQRISPRRRRQEHRSIMVNRRRRERERNLSGSWSGRRQRMQIDRARMRSRGSVVRRRPYTRRRSRRSRSRRQL